MKSRNTFFLILLSISISLFTSCKKDKKNPLIEESNSPTSPTLTWEPLELWPNVHVMDSVKYTLDLSPSLINNGTYQFSFTGSTPTILSGDIIIGHQGLGYIRKVTSVVVNTNTIVLQTTQGTMADVFKNGEFNFNMNMDSMHQKVASSGFSYSINNKTIYQNGVLNIVLNNGQIDLNPNWFFDFGFNSSGINYFVMESTNGTLNGNFKATVTASTAANLIDKTDTLTHYTKKITRWIMVGGVPVPVVVVVDLDLLVNYSAAIGAAISRSGTFTSNNTFNLGVNYTNSQWTGINNFSTNNSYSLSPITSLNENLTIDLALIPSVNVKLYGVAGPYASIGLKEKMVGNIGFNPKVGVDFTADVWLKTTAGANVTVLGNTLANYSNSWETSKLSYITPYSIDIVSGNNQTGAANQMLSNPLKVKVIDNFNLPQSNIPVYFSVTSGGGSISTNSVLTDAGGFAQSNWTLGSSGTQSVNVSVFKANQNQILNSPIVFSANLAASDWTITSISTGEVKRILKINNTLFVSDESFPSFGIKMSSDSGSTWTSCNNGFNLSYPTDGFSTDGSRFFASSGCDIFMSSNLGGTWTQMSLPPSVCAAKSFNAIGSNIFYGTNNHDFWVSNDGGTSWNQKTWYGAYANFWSIALNGNDVFVAVDYANNTGSAFLLHSNDNFSTQDIKVIPGGNKVFCVYKIGSKLWAGTNQGLFSSSDNGNTWTSYNSQTNQVFGIAISGSKIFVNTNLGVFVSPNNGSTWNALDNGIPSTGRSELIIIGSKLFVGTVGNGVWVHQI